MSPLAAFGLLLASGFDSAPPDLTTLAAASERPPSCGGYGSTASFRSPWDRVRRAALVGRCARLARGHALGVDSPKESLAIAVALREEWSTSPAPLLLEAQALVRLRRFAEAWRRFEQARALDPAVPRSPGGLRDLARAAVRTGHLDAARRALRTLLPVAGLLAAPSDAVRVHIEAAALAMLDGPRGLDEAIAYLVASREAVMAPELEELVLAHLALAFDRAGRPEEAAAILEGASGPWRLEALADPEDPVAHHFELPLLPAGEVHALIAMLAEKVDRELAVLHWREFVEQRGAGGFVEHARVHLDALGAR